MSRNPSDGYVSSYLTRPLRSLAEVLSERGEPAEIALQMAALAPAATSTTVEQESIHNAVPRLPASGPLFPVPAHSPVRASLESRRSEINARRAWLVNSGNVAAARALTQELVAIEAALAEPPLSELADLAIAC